MASSAVMTAVRTKLTAEFTRCPVIYPNEGGMVPSDNTAFLEVAYPVSFADANTIGAPGNALFREEGIIHFTLAIPIGMGVEPYATWIEELRTMFRRAHFSGVKTWESSPAATNDESD